MTSRVLTPRVLALAAAAALAGTPLLAGSPAGAQAADAVGTVTFNGGCGLLGSGLGGKSTPDTTQLSVPAGSGVRFANGLGQPATLLLNGSPVGEVPAGGAADVVFREGPVTASMRVSCMLGSPAGTVTVEVQRVDPTPSSSPPAPSQQPPRTPGGTSAPGGSGTPARSGSEAAGSPNVGMWWSDAPAQPPADQPDDDATRPSGERADHDDELGARWGNQVDPADGGSTSNDPATVDAELADDELAAQNVSRTTGSTSDDGPIGLLALIATVCVVGVSAGAIRALVTQRANRAEWA